MINTNRKKPCLYRETISLHAQKGMIKYEIVPIRNKGIFRRESYKV